MTPTRILFALVFAAAACSAAAQQLYRWTDENGRLNVSDLPPPASAKDKRVVKLVAANGALAKPAAALPYALELAIKQYPVTLYTSPNCAEPCGLARGLLNKRGVPFKEVQVWEQAGNEELKRISGKNQVPALRVGTGVFSGFEGGAYDGLLDSAGYPRAGVLPARAQAAPGRPEGYIAPEQRQTPKAEPVKPEQQAASGPYSAGASPRRPEY
jgi:glutaredoxin